MKNRLKRNKGIALLWVLMLSIVMMIITGTMVTYMIKEARMSVNIEESTQAYAYARTGIDWALANNTPGTYNLDMDPLVAGNELNVVKTATDIKSTGTVGGVKRSIEYTISVGGLAKIEPFGSSPSYVNRPEFTDISQQINPPENRSSFKYKFDFWTSSAVPPTDNKFGLAAAAGNLGTQPSIYLNLRSGSNAPQLVVSNGTSTATTSLNFIGSRTSLFSGAATEREYSHYRAEIKYISETSVTATIKEFSGSSYACVASGTFNLASQPASWGAKNLGNLTYIYAAGTSGQSYTTTGSFEDLKYTILDGGVNDVYVDNVVIYDRAPVIAANYTVTVNKSGTGNGSVASFPTGISGSSYPLTASFTAGSPVIITATPTSGTVTWTGCTSTAGNVCTITSLGANTVVTVDYYVAAIVPLVLKNIEVNSTNVQFTLTCEASNCGPIYYGPSISSGADPYRLVINYPTPVSEDANYKYYSSISAAIYRAGMEGPYWFSMDAFKCSKSTANPVCVLAPEVSVTAGVPSYVYTRSGNNIYLRWSAGFGMSAVIRD